MTDDPIRIIYTPPPSRKHFPAASSSYRARALAVRIFKDKAYVVLEAARGEEALSLSKKHTGSIDLLLTDVVMPGMSGRELAKQVAMSRPGI